MRIILRIIAVFVALAAILTFALVVSFAFNGILKAIAHSAKLGVITIGAWLILLTAGPVAAVQLWRLRRIGLWLTTTLCALAFTYYLTGLFFLRGPGAPLMPVLEAIVVNGVLLALLLSPGARRACA